MPHGTSTKIEDAIMHVQWGRASLKGRRAYMEDFSWTGEIIWEVPEEYKDCANVEEPSPGVWEMKAIFLSVFDGHAGASVASFAAENLRKILRCLLFDEFKKRASAGEKDMEAACIAAMAAGLREAFIRCSQHVVKNGLQGGSTATVALLVGRRIVIANAGDSPAILVRRGRPVRLSANHRPENAEEAKRVRDLGGFIGTNGRLCNMISVTRSLGDAPLAPFLIPDPSISIATAGSTDSALLITSDGVTDTMSDAECIRALRSSFAVPPSLTRGISTDSGGTSSDSHPGGCSYSALPTVPDQGEDCPAIRGAVRIVSEAHRKGSQDNLSCVVALLSTPSRTTRGAVRGSSKGSSPPGEHKAQGRRGRRVVRSHTSLGTTSAPAVRVDRRTSEPDASGSGARTTPSRRRSPTRRPRPLPKDIFPGSNRVVTEHPLLQPSRLSRHK
eukprot:Rmarinus@m.21147